MVETREQAPFLALDDVQVQPGPCEGHEPSPDIEPGPDTGLIHPRNFSCNFDDGNLCAWSNKHQNRNDGGVWLTSDPDINQVLPWMPRGDHTTGDLRNGHYIYASAFIGSQSDAKLSIVDTNRLPSGDICLSLWYILMGASSELNVRICPFLVQILTLFCV